MTKPDYLLDDITHNHPAWEMIKPLPLFMQVDSDEDGKYYIISDNVFHVYGDGDFPYKAMADYEVSLIDYYEIRAASTIDNEASAALFRELQKYLRPKRESDD